MISVTGSIFWKAQLFFGIAPLSLNSGLYKEKYFYRLYVLFWGISFILIETVMSDFGLFALSFKQAFPPSPPPPEELSASCFVQ